MRAAAEGRQSLVTSMGPSFDAGADVALARKTYDEVKRGNLRGPFQHDELVAQVGPLYVPSRRFVAKQGTDCRECRQRWRDGAVADSDLSMHR